MVLIDVEVNTLSLSLILMAYPLSLPFIIYCHPFYQALCPLIDSRRAREKSNLLYNYMYYEQMSPKTTKTHAQSEIIFQIL